MAYIPKEVVAKAKEMDLLTYLRNHEPSELVRLSGNVYSTKSHDSLKISNGRWMWWSRSIGGRSALDYLIKVKGYSFLEAVEMIVGNIGESSMDYGKKEASFTEESPPPDSKNNPPKTKSKIRGLNLPERNDNENRVIHYLKSRSINEFIIKDCIDNGMIYESKRYHNAVFVGTDEEAVPRFGCYRSTNDKRIMGDLSGSNKRYSFQMRCKKSPVLHVFEGAIDLLSYATLLRMKGYDWKKTNLLSLSGVYAPQKNVDYRLPIALNDFLKRNPQIQKIYLQLDNDRPGKLATQGVQRALPDKYTVGSCPPPQGKDYNSYLQTLQNNEKKIQEGGVNVMEEKKLTILVIKPNEKPKVMEIDDSLKAMQEVVGGYIQEVMPFKDDVAVICNEEGKLQNLPPNRAFYDKEGKVTDIVVGDFFICRAPTTSDSFESLNREDIKKYSEIFQYPERFSKRGGEITASKIKPNKEEQER